MKGYSTNTTLTIAEVVDNYKELWIIEKAFRINKNDIKIRPIYHRLPKRIEAHTLYLLCGLQNNKGAGKTAKRKKIRHHPKQNAGNSTELERN